MDKAKKLIRRFWWRFSLLLFFSSLFGYIAFHSYACSIWKNSQATAAQVLLSKLEQTDTLPSTFKKVVETLRPLHKCESHRLLLDWSWDSPSSRGPYGKYNGYGIECYTNKILAEWDRFNLGELNEWTNSFLSERLTFSLFIYKKDLHEEIQNFYYLHRKINNYISKKYYNFVGVKNAAKKTFGKELELLSDKEAIIIYTLFEPTTPANDDRFDLNKRVEMNEQIYTQRIQQ